MKNYVFDLIFYETEIIKKTKLAWHQIFIMWHICFRIWPTLTEISQNKEFPHFHIFQIFALYCLYNISNLSNASYNCQQCFSTPAVLPRLSLQIEVGDVATRHFLWHQMWIPLPNATPIDRTTLPESASIVVNLNSEMQKAADIVNISVLFFPRQC